MDKIVVANLERKIMHITLCIAFMRQTYIDNGQNYYSVYYL